MSDLSSFLTALESAPGVAAARRLETSRARGKIDIRGGAPMKGRIESVIAYPDRMAVTLDTGTLKIRQVLDGETSWIMQNNAVIDASEPVLQTLRNNLFHNLNNLYRFILDPAHRDRLGLGGGNGQTVLTLDRGEGAASTVRFDDSLKIVGVELESPAPGGGTIHNRIEYTDFRAWDELLYPVRVTVYKDGAPLSEIAHDSYEGNVEVSPDLFAKPRA
jgi:hypothetical protein